MTRAMTRPYRLVAVETHPIQYKAPLFRILAQEAGLDLTVLYAMLPDARQQGAGFGVPFSWDVPLLDGYRHEVLENRAKVPGVTHFSGCDTPGIGRALDRLRPDAVLMNGWVVKTCLQALWACRRRSIPAFVRGEANLLRPRAWWKHALHRLLLKQYQAYLAIGSANHAFYRFHRCPEDRIFDAPYVVDNAYFAAAAAGCADRRADLRAAFGIPADAVVFLFSGKLEAKKRPMDVLKALERVSAFPRSRGSAFLLVAGTGPLRDACEQFARDQKIPAAFPGFLNQSRLPDAYAAADVLVLPSDAGETWGLVVNEAMASGRPAVVSTSAGCCADLVVEDQTGHAFGVGDVDRLAAIIDGYLREPDRARRQGEAATRHIQTFCFQRTAAGILDAMNGQGAQKAGRGDAG